MEYVERLFNIVYLSDESEVVCSHDDRFQQKSTEFQSVVGKATELMETASALNQVS